MSFTGKKAIQKIIAIFVILILILADFAIIGANVVSYAIDMVVTNNENVEFSAYFVNSQNEQIKETDYDINGEDLKLYVEISVKNEGYFNGEISLEDSSFKFNQDSSNENIKSIEDNKVTLNQINAGKTATIELGISYNNSEKVSTRSLNMDNKINLTGIYKNSKKDVEIKGETAVKINWKSADDTRANINATVLTNQNYKINDTNKKVMQVLVNSKLNNNIYPVKNTKIELNIPNGAESVRVHSRSTLATNGNAEFNENNYQYNTETGILTINIDNIEKDGQISWNKNSEDSLVITCVYPENHNLNNIVTVNSIITTYDDKQLSANSQIEIKDSIDGIITNKIIENEISIYKGKIYTDEQRNYNTSTILNVDYAEIVNEIEISEKNAKFINNEQGQNANIQYLQSKINKSNFTRIFGEEGTLTILDQDGNTISNINKDTEVDENGNIIINYSKGITAITIKTSKPITEGVLEINHTKAIKDNNLSREEVKELKQIQEEVQSKYLKTEGENTNNAIGTIELKDTASKANIKINKQTLSTITTNENVEIVATLETNDESKDLYKNPKVSIVFPKEIKAVNITQATALYRNGLEKPISSITRNENGNIVINLEFKGEQEKYNSEILNGLEIHFFGSVEIDKSIPSKDVELIMNYNNENSDEGTIETKTTIHLESQYGLMLYNKVENYNSNNENVETIDNNEVEARLDIQKEGTSPRVTTALVNNYNRDLENIEIIGNVPSEDDTNTFNSSLKNLKVNNKNAKVLYNTNINASSNDQNWTESDKNAKSYKIVIDKITAGSTAKITYNVDVEDNLSYNEVGAITTNANYNYGDKSLNKNSNIILATEKATIMEETEGTTSNTEAGLTVNVVATSGTKELKENDSIYNGETIKYTVNIVNNTDRNLTGVNVKAVQTNGKIFGLVEKEVYNPYYKETSVQHFWEKTDSNETTLGENINIAKGENVTLEYQVVANKQDENQPLTYGDIIVTSQNNEFNEQKITTIKNQISDAELSLMFTQNVSEECEWYSNTIQTGILTVTNTSSNKLENIEVQITLVGELNCEYDGTYIDSPTIENIENIEKEYNKDINQTIITLSIKSLNVGDSIQIHVKPYITLESAKFEETQNVEFYAKATTNSKKTYNANIITRTVKKIGKNIDVTQSAKINNVGIDQNTVATNGDTIEFNVVIKNLDDEKTNLNIKDFIPTGLNVESIELIRNDKSTINLMNEYNNLGYLKYDDIILVPNEQIIVKIIAKVDTSLISEDTKVINKIEVNDNTSSIIYSAQVEFGIKILQPDDGNLNITVLQEASIENGSIINNGDQVEYKIKLSNTCDYDRTVSIYDYINTSIRNISVSIDNNDVTDKFLSDNDLEVENYTLKPNTNTDITIKGTVDLDNYTEGSISNLATVKSSIADTMSNTITYYTSEESKQESNNENNGSNSNFNNGETTEETQNNYTIKGKAWIDNNEDGKRDDDEESIQNMTIRAINTQTNEVLTDSVTTGTDGSYQITLPQGTYVIVFMYNDEDYYITTYQADGVDSTINSDAVTKTLNIDGKDSTVGTTDVINLTSNQENIDIGLVLRNKFDLKIEKYVSRIVVTNDGGTETYDFDNSDLAKVEIHSKYLSGSTVVVEYKIKVTNVGDIEGYVKSIVDYMPSDFKFSSDLNADWYQSGDYLYNENIANTNLAAGESTEVTLILTKNMTESNTGLVNNTAAIQSSYNEKSFSDANSDNNNGSADVIISVKTGAAIRLVLITLGLTVIIAGIAYVIAKKYIYKKI